jgi:arylsulfatase A-like enzyme
MLLIGTTTACAPAQPPTNLLLITVDTTRADRLGAYGYESARTPTLDRLAMQGTLYERAYGVVPETLPAHVSLFTGLYPPSHGVRLNLQFKLPEEATTLAEILSERGLQTVAVCSAAVLHPRYGLDQGFQEYLAPGVRAAPGMQPPTEWSAEQVVTEVLTQMWKREPGPYFLWAHFYDPHSPFEPREPFSAPEDARPESPELYDLEIAYMDHWIGRMLDELETRGDLENTLIVVTGDHGESLGEHGELYHTLFIYDATIHVPMIIAGPGVKAGRRITEVVSSVDLFATILRLFGVDPPFSSSRVLPGLGVSPTEENPERIAYSDSMTAPLRYGWNALESIRTTDWLYVRAPDEELYRLDGSDPGQEFNLAFDERETVEELNALLVETIGSMPDTGFGDQTSHLASEQEMKALEALGYVAASPDQAAPDTGRGLDPKDMVEVAEAFQLARHAMGKREFEVAKKHLEWAAAADPENVGVWMLLARVHASERNFTAALEALGQALEIRPGACAVLIEIASLEETTGDVKAAEETLGQALEACDQPIEVWRRFGRMRLQTGNLEGAEDAFRRILDIDADDERAQAALEAIRQRREMRPAARRRSRSGS